MITRDATRTVWYQKPGKDGRSGRDVVKVWNAIIA
jgi:hypothetical protein